MRGKHAASAAKHRAETAESQLDRLLPKLVDAEREAKRYRAEAEAAVVLRRQLAEIKDRTGVPMNEHLAAIRQQEELMEETLAAYDEAVKFLLDRLVDAGMLAVDAGEAKHVDDKLLLHLHVIPQYVTAKLLTAIGWGRYARRNWPTPESAQRLHESDHGKPSPHGQLVELSERRGQEYAKWRSAKREAERTADDRD